MIKPGVNLAIDNNQPVENARLPLHYLAKKEGPIPQTLDLTVIEYYLSQRFFATTL